jgi:NitT/TauT family transport system substrate-binding protein
MAARRGGRTGTLLRSITLAVALTVVAGACGGSGDGGGSGSGSGSGSSPGREKVSLRLDFALTGYHPGFFLAKERGYYEQQGLDVDIQPGTGSGDTIKLVGAGRNTFGFASQTVMALAVGKDEVPVKAIAGVIQKVPDAIFSRADSNIRTPKDLEGKTWGATANSSGEQAFPAFAKKTGVDVGKVRRVNVAVNAKLPAMVNGSIDWMTNFSFTKAAELDQQGVKYNMILYSDYLTILGHGLLASTSTIESKPDLVRKFVTASMRGLQEALDDPKAAVAAMVKENPELSDKSDLLEKQLTGMADFVHTDNSEGKPLGWQAPQDWDATVAFLKEYLGLGDVNAADLYTNDFVQ